MAMEKICKNHKDVADFLDKVRVKRNGLPLYHREREKIIYTLEDLFEIERIEWSPITDELQIDVVCLDDDDDYSSKDLEKFARKLPRIYPFVTIGETYSSGPSYFCIEFTGGNEYRPSRTSPTLVIHIL